MWRPVDRLGAGGEGAWLPALLPARHPGGVKAPTAIRVVFMPNARKAHAYWPAALRGVESQSACAFPAYEQSGFHRKLENRRSYQIVLQLSGNEEQTESYRVRSDNRSSSKVADASLVS